MTRLKVEENILVRAEVHGEKFQLRKVTLDKYGRAKTQHQELDSYKS